MNKTLWIAFAMVAVGGVGIAACGDTSGTGGSGGTGGSATTTSSSTSSSSSKSSTGTGTGSTTSTGTGTSSSSTGGGTCDVPNDMNDTCAHACAAAFDCGALVCSGTNQLCTGFAPMGTLTKVQFTSSCEPQCTAVGIATFKTAIMTNDCNATITALKGSSAAFAGICTPP